MDQSELNCLDAWRSRADERGDVVGDGVPTGDGRERDVLVDRVVSEERRQFDCADVVGPRSAEPTHYIDRTLHVAPPSTRVRPFHRREEAIPGVVDQNVQPAGGIYGCPEPLFHVRRGEI